MRAAMFALIAMTASPLLGVTIEKVLPFTPTTNSVRIVTTLGGADENVELSGAISPHGKKGTIWTGRLEKSTLIDKLDVKPWSPGNPQLYDLRVRAKPRSGEPVTKLVRFGFRQIESKNGNVYLNGKPIFLRGLAINPPGRTVPAEVGTSRQFAYDYVKYLRGQNVNLIRLTETSQEWFDVCDELGMMIYQGFYGSPPVGSAEETTQPALANQDEAVGKRLPKNLERSERAYLDEFETYVHHPSIVIYVLSNELPYKGEPGKQVHDFLSAMFDRLSKWDHTRLYIGNAGYGEGHEGDLNDVHRYWGWYYNTFATYYNLRDPKLFGDVEKNQPFTFSECVGNFTGPNGAYNCIERKQLAAALTWTGTAQDQPKEAQAYQAFMNKQAIELWRRLRAVNPRMSGLMPFTITFHNWRGIQSFDEMKPTAAAKQSGVSYQPVLLSWELWQTQVYAGAKIQPRVHAVNDAEDFSDLTNATLQWELRGTSVSGKIELPKIPYYGTWSSPIELNLPNDLKTGEYVLLGRIEKDGQTISSNEQLIFIAGGEWKKQPVTKRRIIKPSDDWSDPPNSLLIIEEGSWDDSLKSKLKPFISGGGRVLCLAQSHDKFDASWLPAHLAMCMTSVNSPDYMTPHRPAADGMNINPLWADHPVFAGVDRDRLKMWSDPSDWDESKPGFPGIYPVEHGFELTRPEDLGNVAIIADYDVGLSGTALCEMFDGEGSVMLCGFGISKRVGVDPVADRLLANMIEYMASDTPHQRHPLIKEPIRWGDFATQHGVISGPINGLFYNTVWLPPPTEPDARPLSKNQGAWNTRPGDQFVPRGVRPRGPFHYTFNCGPRDDEKSAPGRGAFFATVPRGKREVVTRVRNPLHEAATIQVDVNDSTYAPAEVPANSSITIRSALTPALSRSTGRGSETRMDVGVRYTGDRELIIEETDFR